MMSFGFVLVVYGKENCPEIVIKRLVDFIFNH